MDLCPQFLDFFGWSGLDLGTHDQATQVHRFGQATAFGICLQPFSFLRVQPEAQFVLLFHGTPFSAVKRHMGTGVSPASRAKIASRYACVFYLEFEIENVISKIILSRKSVQKVVMQGFLVKTFEIKYPAGFTGVFYGTS
jgi:hypothetical protein